MSHEFESGFFGEGKAAWHSLGTVIEGTVDSKEAIKLAQLDWQVIQSPVIFQSYPGQFEEIPGYILNVRDKDKKPLGIVTKAYKVVQNVDAFNFMDGLVSEGAIHYETAGSLREGRIVWMLARLNEDQIIGDDLHHRYLLLTNSHDGSKALRVFWTNVRVVCMNTLSAALYSMDTSFCFRHIGDVAKHMEVAQDILGLANSRFDSYKALGEKLMTIKFSKKEVDNYLDYLLPDSVENKKSKDPRLIRNQMKAIINSGGIELDTYKGTAWAALQSTIQFNTWEIKARNDDTRVRSLWFGTGSRVNQKALTYMQDFAKEKGK